MLPELPALTFADLGYAWADLRVVAGGVTMVLLVLAATVIPRRKRITR